VSQRTNPSQGWGFGRRASWRPIHGSPNRWFNIGSLRERNLLHRPVLGSVAPRKTTCGHFRGTRPSIERHLAVQGCQPAQTKAPPALAGQGLVPANTPDSLKAASAGRQQHDQKTNSPRHREPRVGGGCRAFGYF